MQLEFETLDVFTDRAYGGNPLAVVFGGDALDGGEMQTIAREFNLSETVFVLPPDDPAHAARARIFTPKAELPFAGHPTIGTALLLAWRAGGAPEVLTLVLEEGAGPVPVEIELRDGRPAFARLTAPKAPEIRDTLEPDLLARIAGLEPDDLVLEGGLPQAVSVGIPFMILEVRDRAALARVAPDLALWRTHHRERWTQDLLVVTRDAVEGTDLQVRMLAPLGGIPEDPATGSAAGALAAWLGTRELEVPGRRRWVVAQGLEMGRPSRLEIEAERTADGTITARVGGSAVRVMAGRLTVPERS